MAHLLEAHAERLEDSRGDPTLFANKSEEKVLGSDVVVPESSRLIDGELDHLLRPRRKADLTDDWALAATDDELDCLPNLRKLDVEVFEDLCRNPLTLANEPEEEVKR
jgi:hypothetical protein